MDKVALAKKIAAARQEMIALGAKHGLNSTSVLEASERLDSLLNAYENMSSPKEKAFCVTRHQKNKQTITR